MLIRCGTDWHGVALPGAEHVEQRRSLPANPTNRGEFGLSAKSDPDGPDRRAVADAESDGMDHVVEIRCGRAGGTGS